MDGKTSFALLAGALTLLACERTQEVPKEEAAPAPASSPAPGPRAGADGGVPAAAPPRLTPEAERGAEGARNLLLSFARAIERGDYGDAWVLLGPADRRKWSRPAFAALFADVAQRDVAIPAGTMEGAAGSSYYAAPVTITGRDRAGRPIRLEGRAVLRRVNDIEGATAEQLRWHFETLMLDRADAD